MLGKDCWNDEISSLFFRYGVEPPVLVKLEKEIELEETLLNTSGPEDSISIPKSCCQHEELHEAVSSCHTCNHDVLVFEFATGDAMFKRMFLT